MVYDGKTTEEGLFGGQVVKRPTVPEARDMVTNADIIYMDVYFRGIQYRVIISQEDALIMLMNIPNSYKVDVFEPKRGMVLFVADVPVFAGAW